MAEQNNNQQDLNQLLQVRYDKLHELQENGKDPFVITKYDVTNHSTDIIDNFETMEGKPVSIAGRMMFKRVMGKASFCNIQDLKGRIQVYVARDNIGEEIYKDFKKSDIGDIWGVKGYAFRTKTGEISIHAEEMTLLSKSLQILPEKFHGLTDTDMRYRQRYIDLIMNQESKEVFIKRSKILKEIRNFLADRDFMEVETPMLVSNAGGAAARPFETHYNALNEDVKLRISLELYLKRLIVGGLERVYEIGRVFRNEGVDTRHNPEFTLMELYQAYTDYEGMMELTESMFRYLAEKVCGSTKISYNGIEIDLGKPFTRMTMNDAIKKYTGIDFDTVEDDAAAKKLADEHHIAYEERHKKGDIINLFFEEFCEKELIQPTFIMDHPIEISPLTKKKPSDPTKVERFELFCNTWEMCNAYSELNDPVDQRQRFEAQEEMVGLGYVINGSALNSFELCNYQEQAPYMFISKDNMLYLYYMSNSTLYPCAQFESNITSMNVNIYYNRCLMVGLENGDVVILKGIRSADGEPNLDRYVINGGNTIQVTDAENDFVLFHEKDFGRVVQVFYRWNMSWNEYFY